jgi:hypothetical protein
MLHFQEPMLIPALCVLQRVVPERTSGMHALQQLPPIVQLALRTTLSLVCSSFEYLSVSSVLHA